MTPLAAARRKVLSATAVAATLGVAAAVGGVRAGWIGSSGHPRALRATYTTAAASTETFAHAHVTIAPPPTGAQPTVTASQALATVSAVGIRPDVLNTIVPHATLANFTDSVLGIPDDDTLSGQPKYVNVLAWVVTFPNAPTRPIGSMRAVRSRTAPPPPVPCDLNAVVDATSGQLIEEFQACGG